MLEIKKHFLDLFFPIYCFGCRKEGVWLCKDCLKKIKINSDFVAEFVDPAGNLDKVLIACDYNQPILIKILYGFKYQFAVEISEVLVEILKEYLLAKKNQNYLPSIDLVTAVPLSRKRQNWRGFNQAEIIAEKISQEFNWPYSFQLISIQFNNLPQAKLKSKERVANVRNIFGTNLGISLKNKKILIIDDVLTTGSTLSECAKNLKKLGAKEVIGLVIAKG